MKNNWYALGMSDSVIKMLIILMSISIDLWFNHIIYSVLRAVLTNYKRNSVRIVTYYVFHNIYAAINSIFTKILKLVAFVYKQIAKYSNVDKAVLRSVT